MKPTELDSMNVLRVQAERRVAELEDALRQIGDFAHDKSTGPAVPDALWEVRSMAYDALRADGVGGTSHD